MPAFFIPARSSRHRTACLALYRALLQQAPRIRLPEDLATAWGPVNPVKHLVQRAFRRNRADTSPRLVYPALKAGYQILALLQSAVSSSSSAPAPENPNPDYASIVSFLRARLAERNRSLAAKQAHPPYSRTPPKPTTAPRPGLLPLLVNVTPAPTPENPDPTPKYATPSRPRPASALGGSGRRRVPRLDMASDIPFLRITKPQPALLSRVLTQKIRQRVARMEALQSFWEDHIPDAELEDDWERIMAQMLGKQGRLALGKGGGRSNSSSNGRNGDDSTITPDLLEARVIQQDLQSRKTFRQGLFDHGIMYLQDVLNRQRVDHVARADALRQLIKEEAKLAKQEKAQRSIERRKRWEAKMQELHGEGWRKLFPNLDAQDSKPHSSSRYAR